MLALLCALAVSADPAADVQLDLLKKFREEFVAITPGEGKYPAGKVNRPFAIAKFEVPQNLWQTVTGDNPSKWKGPRNGAEMMTWSEAVQFCRTATKLMRTAKLIDAGEEIRLPTEAEWEYCCRAGTTTAYSFGDDVEKLGEYAWFTGNAAGNDPPGGAKKANPWGLYDMHGYLREWCADSLGRTDMRVVRSGSWKDKAEQLESSARMVISADTRDDAVGFRCVLAAVPKAPPEFKPTAQESIVPAGAKLELLWGEGIFTEGPAVAPDGSIFFSDIGNTIYRYDPATGKTAKFREPSGRSNGMMFNRDGALVVCEGANSGGGRRISITTGIQGDKDGVVKTLTAAFEGKKFNSPNDLAIGPDGWVYFTDPRYGGDEPRELDYEGVFSVGSDGTTLLATRDVEKPNGIIFAPDGKRVYVADNNPAGNRHLVAFELAEHRLVKKEQLWDFGPGRGIDGMSLDREGNIYATAGTGEYTGVYVFSPSGKPLALIPTPGDPTNCCFGRGDDAKTLYVTAATKEGKKFGLFRIGLAKAGYNVSDTAAK